MRNKIRKLILIQQAAILLLAIIICVLVWEQRKQRREFLVIINALYTLSEQRRGDQKEAPVGSPDARTF